VSRHQASDSSGQPRQERCQGSGDGSGGRLLPGPALEDAASCLAWGAWLCCWRDRVGKQPDQGTVGRRERHESCPTG